MSLTGRHRRSKRKLTTANRETVKGHGIHKKISWVRNLLLPVPFRYKNFDIKNDKNRLQHKIVQCFSFLINGLNLGILLDLSTNQHIYSIQLYFSQRGLDWLRYDWKVHRQFLNSQQDLEFFNWLNQEYDSIFIHEKIKLQKMITKSCELKILVEKEIIQKAQQMIISTFTRKNYAFKHFSLISLSTFSSQIIFNHS